MRLVSLPRYFTIAFYLGVNSTRSRASQNYCSTHPVESVYPSKSSKFAIMPLKINNSRLKPIFLTSSEIHAKCCAFSSPESIPVFRQTNRMKASKPQIVPFVHMCSLQLSQPCHFSSTPILSVPPNIDCIPPENNLPSRVVLLYF